MLNVKLGKEVIRTRKQLVSINRLLGRLQKALEGNKNNDDLKESDVDADRALSLLRAHKECIVNDLIDSQKHLNISRATVLKCRQDALAAMRDSARIVFHLNKNLDLSPQ